ncbi:MAG: hypothetical protein NTZ93_03395 [Candidatus Beckwithbacteria bacterium]|nr:hypothetical protein [Candidatus Beckwithbacteria bacterium]
MSLLRWFYQLSWKKIMGFGIFLLLVAVIPISIQVATNQTRTRSEAALIHPSVQPVTDRFETPAGPPKIYLVDHFFGKVGDSVLIHGENLGGIHPQSAVYLAGTKIPHENLVSWTGSYIEFKVPEGAKSGIVEVNILGQKTSWPGMFFVTDEYTEAELALTKNQNIPNVANLTATNIQSAEEILVWLLIFSGDGGLTISPLNATITEQNIINLPIGKVYELKLTNLNEKGELLKIVKGEKQMVGIARAEISRADNTLIPVKSNPLYVSF